MKRDEALQQLSRDHHRALEVALRLRRASAADAEEVRDLFLEFWREHGSVHFRVEEDVMLPLSAPDVDPTDEAVIRVLTDHVEIRRRAFELEKGPDPDPAGLNELGELLNDHVRHEERVLFPLIEQRLTADELSRLAERIEVAERSASPPA